MRLDHEELMRADVASLRRLAVFAGLVSDDVAEILTASELRAVLVSGGVASSEHPPVRELRELGYL